MKILSIGNSFSQNAQRYLHMIGQANNNEIKCVNLCIGGCTLRQHYLNAVDNEKSYSFEFNGNDTGIKVSVKDALKSDEWDYVTVQQASHKSFDFDTYVPYILKLKEYIKIYSPKTKIALHQTWAYTDTEDVMKHFGFNSTKEMFESVRKAYSEAEKVLEPEVVIKSGEAMLRAYEAIGRELYSDALHASKGVGKYLLGCVWYKAFFGEAPQNDIKYFDAEVSEEQIRVIRQIIQ